LRPSVSPAQIAREKAEKEERATRRREQMTERRDQAAERRQRRRELIPKATLSDDAKAASKLRLAKQFLDEGQIETGKKWLKKVVETFPTSAAASEARLLRAKTVDPSAR